MTVEYYGNTKILRSWLFVLLFFSIFIMKSISLIHSTFCFNNKKLCRQYQRLHMSTSQPKEPLYLETPLVRSLPMSNLFEGSTDIWLKLDCLQPSGSFKDRGMARLTSSLKAQGISKLISSSGGNAGHSASHAGRILGMDVKVIVPTTTKPIMLEKIRAQGAEVQVHGKNWNAADELARELCESDPEAAYVSPYDDPLLWKGHSSIVDELHAINFKPDAIVASVGGGGLLCGIYQGLERYGWNDVQVIATETKGADSFAASFQAGEMRRLDSIDSIATSLGALEVTEQALIYSKNQPTTSAVVSDSEAVDACFKFLQDHRMFVEPACGAALSLAYSSLQQKYLSEMKSVLMVVCGGSGVNLDIALDWKKTFDNS